MRAASSGTRPFYEELALAGLHASPLRPGGLGLTERALSQCRFPANAGLLDLGCGNGATVEHLMSHWGLRAVGVDPSPLLLAHGLDRGKGLRLVRAEGEHLPFRAGSWDGILLECVLSTTGDTESVIGECARVLKPGGHLIVTDVYLRAPREPRPLENAPTTCCLSGALEMPDFQYRLLERGFTTILWEDHSKALKELAAELILADIPVNRPLFCPKRGREPRGASPTSTDAPALGKPGYFLLIARLEERHETVTL